MEGGVGVEWSMMLVVCGLRCSFGRYISTWCVVVLERRYEK